MVFTHPGLAPGSKSEAGPLPEPPRGQAAAGTSTSSKPALVDSVRRGRRAAGRFMWRVGVRVSPVVVLLLVKTFLIGIYTVPSESMETTLMPGDRILAQRVALGEIKRGDVIVFDGAGSFDPYRPLGDRWDRVVAALRETIGTDDRRMYVKRVIGLPGETVQCCDVQGRLLITRDGVTVALREPYLYEDDEQQFAPVTIPDGHVWVMGDHRSRSADSRTHIHSEGGGFVPLERIQGRAIATIWPVPRWHRIKRVDIELVPGAAPAPAVDTAAAISGTPG